MKKCPRVVFDCNVLLQAVVSESGPAAECLRRLERGQIAVAVSRATLKELRRILYHPAVRESLAGLTDVRAEAFLARLTFRATLVRRVPHVFDLPRDPADEPYVDLAIAADADFLVTRDQDLISLMTSRTVHAKQFRQRTRPLQVVDPRKLLAALDG